MVYSPSVIGNLHPLIPRETWVEALIPMIIHELEI